ncbi:FHA domain-containing protein [Pseudenhygromyxa sp. WMMC2535]|uniref:FHA domain-containing protein n=1 Tax=Pseudenhygromyxa sp. WMMC2535 TaxID=2712867 RepID=UPI0015963486|nr:FHA domain-containing protein [Pseudenhygromyxa sp. WMMC2535]NVB42087.1 FHA domain-containing protein [Pseudenhygromyxa sp. WMMC2535]
MELGLACPVCGQLNTIRSTSCSRCGTVLAPAAQMQASAASSAPPGPPAPPAPPGAAPPSPLQNQPPPMQPQASYARTAVAPPPPPPSAPRYDAATGQALGGDPNKPAAKTMFFGALQQQAVTPRLVVIKGEGGDGVTYHLSGTSHLVGRSEGDISFAEDVFLSPEHAKFTVQDGRLFVQDLSNNNGVFVRIKRPVLLDNGDSFLLGEQLLHIDSRPLPDYAPDAQGTYFYGSPRPNGAFRIVQQLAGGGEGLIRSANGNTLSMGREGNDLDFPDDRFISGHHAKLDLSDDAKVLLTDTGSRNGTFIRIKGAQELFHGDYLFVGQQLFRVEIS